MPSAQSKPDASKADDASPFALLVGSLQAKPATQQPSTGQKNTQGKDSQNSGDKQSDASGKTLATTADTSAQTASQVPVKPVKADKSDDKNSKDKGSDSSDGTDTSLLSASLQQIDPQALPAIQMSAQQLASLTATNAAIANNDAGDDAADTSVPDVAAAGATAANSQASTQNPAQNFLDAVDQSAASQTAGQANGTDGQPPVAAKGQAKGQPNDQTNGQANVQPNGQANAQTNVQANGQAGTQASGSTPAQQATGAQPQGAAANQKQSASQPAAPQPTGVQSAGVQPTGMQPDGVQQPAKPWQAKNQAASDASTAKTDASQAAKADDVKQAVTPAPQAIATSDTQAPKQDATLGNAMPVIGGPQQQVQGAQANSAPTVTQNVQVSTPTPNMPVLAVEIAARSQSGAKQFDIRLDPPELGRVEVRLSIDATGKASAHLSADQPRTLDLLQKDAPALTRALRDAGLDVSQNGLNFSLRQQAGDSGAGQGQKFGGSGRSFTLSATSSIEATSASAAYSSAGDGRLDIRV